MLKKLFVFSFLILLFSGAFASEGNVNDKLYLNMIEKIKKGDKKVDFLELRDIYVKSSYYNPYGDKKAKKIRLKIAEIFKKKKYKKVLNLSKKVFDRDFFDLNTHYMCLISAKKLNLPEVEEFHKYIINSVVDSIVNYGDGKSLDTAYKIISTREEEFILTVLGFVTITRHEIRKNGHIYDKIFAESLNDGSKRTFYFNKDIPNKWLNEKYSDKNCKEQKQ